VSLPAFALRPAASRMMASKMTASNRPPMCRPLVRWILVGPNWPSVRVGPKPAAPAIALRLLVLSASFNIFALGSRLN
jgi:hypothetical protein